MRVFHSHHAASRPTRRILISPTLCVCVAQINVSRLLDAWNIHAADGQRAIATTLHTIHLIKIESMAVCAQQMQCSAKCISPKWSKDNKTKNPETTTKAASLANEWWIARRPMAKRFAASLKTRSETCAFGAHKTAKNSSQNTMVSLGWQ